MNDSTEPASAAAPVSRVASETEPGRRLTPLRATLQIVGFAAGLGVLAWCINNAVQSGNFEHLHAAGWRDTIPLVTCTLISMIANGAIFWALIRPMTPLRLLDLQLINCIVNLLNYAPVRLGLITRVTYHRRVDRLSYPTLVAWYAAFALLYLIMLGSLVAASLIRPQFDFIWCAVLVAFLCVAGAAVWYVSQHHLVTSRLRGADRFLAFPTTIAIAMGLRMIDVAAYIGRLHFSFRLLDTDIRVHDTITLALISMIGNLSPAGALGLREGAVTFFGQYLTDPTLAGARSAAILVDRAAEAAVFIPLGLGAFVWLVVTLRRHRASGTEASGLQDAHPRTSRRPSVGAIENPDAE